MELLRLAGRLGMWPALACAHNLLQHFQQLLLRLFRPRKHRFHGHDVGVLPRRTTTRRRKSDWSKGRFVATETHWMLAPCRPVEILCRDRGDDRRAELPECHGGVILWQEAKWVGALDNTDMCDEDVVIMRLLGIASTATASQCSVLWMRCVERSEPVMLGCVLDRSEASWAIAQFSSRTL